MHLPDRHLLLGMTLGALCATALSAIGPGAVFADEPEGPAIDPDALVRIADRFYDITYEDWVATEPLSRATVKKIGYGSTSYVEISTTETGTYSTDGLASPHVLYAGIEVKEVASASFPPILLLGTGESWVVAPLTKGSSFLHLDLDNGDRIFSHGGGATCLLSNDYTLC
jgi:hypothetical protein